MELHYYKKTDRWIKKELLKIESGLKLLASFENNLMVIFDRR